METLAAANIDQGSILFAHVQQAQGRHRAETHPRQCRCFFVDESTLAPQVLTLEKYIPELIRAPIGSQSS